MGAEERRRQRKCYSSQIVTSLVASSACLIGPREGSTAVASPPPLALQESFSPSGYGRNFPLFSRVMRVGLSTGLSPRSFEGVLSGAEFSEAADFALLVRDLKWLILRDYLDHEIGTFLIPLLAANGTEIETRY